MQNKYGHDRGVVLLAISDESDQRVRTFAASNKINYIVGAEAETTLRHYGVRAFPTVFVFRPDGRLAYKGHSPYDAEKALERVLKEMPPRAGKLGGGA
jgi:peroxiredoxin